MNDATLTALAQSGDPRALGELLRQSEPDLRRFAARVCRSSADADDAVSHAMLTLTQHLGAFRGLSRLSTWVFTVVRNECLRYERLARRWLMSDDATLQVTTGDNPERSHERAEVLDALVVAIRKLPAELREVFVLRELEGLSTEDCAAQLSISEGNVKVRLNRARGQLRGALEHLV